MKMVATIIVEVRSSGLMYIYVRDKLFSTNVGLYIRETHDWYTAQICTHYLDIMMLGSEEKSKVLSDISYCEHHGTRA